MPYQNLKLFLSPHGHNCMIQKDWRKNNAGQNLRCSLFLVYQKSAYRSPSRIPVESTLVSVFYSLIFPIFWRKNPHISFSYMSLLTKLEYKMARETEEKKALKSHMFKNLLSRDGGTRINILVKPSKCGRTPEVFQSVSCFLVCFCAHSLERSCPPDWTITS